MGLDYPHYDWEEIGGVVSPAVLNHPDMRIHHLLIKTCFHNICQLLDPKTWALELQFTLYLIVPLLYTSLMIAVGEVEGKGKG